MNFKSTLEDEINEICDDNNIPDHRGFIIWCTSLLFGIEHDLGVASCDVDGPNDLGLDFGYIDKPNKRIILAQSKYWNESLNRDTIRSFEKIPAILLDPKKVRERGANSWVKDFSRDLRSYYKKDFEIELYSNSRRI